MKDNLRRDIIDVGNFEWDDSLLNLVLEYNGRIVQHETISKCSLKDIECREISRLLILRRYDCHDKLYNYCDGMKNQVIEKMIKKLKTERFIKRDFLSK